MRPAQVRVRLKSNRSSLSNDRNGEAETQRDHVETKAEIGAPFHKPRGGKDVLRVQGIVGTQIPVK